MIYRTVPILPDALPRARAAGSGAGTTPVNPKGKVMEKVLFVFCAFIASCAGAKPLVPPSPADETVLSQADEVVAMPASDDVWTGWVVVTDTTIIPVSDPPDTRPLRWDFVRMEGQEGELLFVVPESEKIEMFQALVVHPSGMIFALVKIKGADCYGTSIVYRDAIASRIFGGELHKAHTAKFKDYWPKGGECDKHFEPNK